jgi:hypothetical protein
MKIKVKLFSVGGIPASDGSIIPRRVIEEYLASDKYKSDIETHKMLGSLTHRVRNWATQTKYTPAIAKTAGKDDQLLCVDVAAPTHYISKIWINDSDQWVYAEAVILNEEGMDDLTIQNIRRIKGLLKQNVLGGVSAVILGYWNTTNSHDELKKLVALKGFDFTLNPSWKDATVTEVISDGVEDTKTFSENFPDNGTIKVKTFSDASAFGIDCAKTSKIGLQYTVLKAKSFSTMGSVEVEGEGPMYQKSFTAATLKERLRYAGFSPRMRFRRMFLDYKQLVKNMGGSEKIKPETLKTLKSLFATDVLDIIKTLSSDIKAGKQINTLIGAGSLGKSVRVAGQKLQLPYRLAMQEADKKGALTPMRYKNLQKAYMEFIQSMTEEVFGSNPIPEGLEEDINKEEGNV